MILPRSHTWMHLLPSSATYRCADGPDWFRALGTHHWVHKTGQQSWDGQGNIHDEMVVEVNTAGLAYVRKGELRPAA